MSVDTSQKTISELLTDLRTHMQELANLQQQELVAVTEHQHETLAQIIEQKQQQLAAIQACDQKLAQHPDASLLAEDETYAAQRTQLKQELTEIQAQNQVNEQLVKVTLSRIEQLRDLLIRTHKQDSVTYDGKGRIR